MTAAEKAVTEKAASEAEKEVLVVRDSGEAKFEQDERLSNLDETVSSMKGDMART